MVQDFGHGKTMALPDELTDISVLWREITARRVNDNHRQTNLYDAIHRHNKPVRWRTFRRLGTVEGDGAISVVLEDNGYKLSADTKDNGLTADAGVDLLMETERKADSLVTNLYAACWRAWKAMGGTTHGICVYTLEGVKAALVCAVPDGLSPRLTKQRI